MKVNFLKEREMGRFFCRNFLLTVFVMSAFCRDIMRVFS